MPLKIEDYGLIGNTHTAALVGSDGSIDWLCAPRFDSGACFAALLGTPQQGRWQIAPAHAIRAVRRSYREASLVLETEFETAAGVVRVVDCMPLRGGQCYILRVVEGVKGRVPMRMELVIRFDYGSVIPWVRRVGRKLIATAGPDTLELDTDVAVRGEDLTSVADFEVAAGERATFVLSHRLSHEPARRPLAVDRELAATEEWWRNWANRCNCGGRWRAQAQRSLITLKALTYLPTGGIVAAPTTSLPERLGGMRNWDYRFCWLRDATFTLEALLYAGYRDEAVAWREWLCRAVAGSPQDLQILYGIAGERRLPEVELEWLAGYEGAAPVRCGNAAHTQFQLDVYGEVMNVLHLARNAELHPKPHVWDIQRVVLDFLESHWQEPDEGIWEIRGPRQHFTHSKMMAWVAFDRAVKTVEHLRHPGPIERWRKTRDAIRDEVCRLGYDAARNTFVQHYGSKELDASLLMMPLVGFLPPSDPRLRGTVQAIESELMADGLILRYSTASGVDGLPAGEGVFLPCSFWLASNLALLGRQAEAETLFERLLTLCNDLGLIAEEYDPRAKRLLGNFPQAMTHVALVNTARVLSGHEHPGGQRPLE